MSSSCVTVSYNLKIKDQEFVLSRDEVYDIYNQLHKVLGIVEPKTSPSYPYPTYPSYPTVFYTAGTSTPNNPNWKSC
jgi:hypothetical protein